MERLRRDAETGWTATSDAALLLELRALSGRILARATETSSAVDALVSEGSRYDVRVRDACTRFRQLEDTAHVEHRVPALGAEDARVLRGSSAASSSSLEEDVPESSRVESRYREALRVTIRTTRGKWLLPAPREGVVAGDVGARDDTLPSSNEPTPNHADERDEGERRDGQQTGSSGEATQTLTKLPPPRLVGNRFWRPLPFVIGTRQFYHDENVTADWSPALAPDEFTAKAVMRGARGASDDDAFSGDDAEGATGETRSNAKNKNHGAATFSTYAWDEASFFGDPAVFEDLSLRAGRESANDVDGTVSSAEEDDTRQKLFGFDDDDDEDEDASRYTESSLSAADDDDAFGDPFAAAARRDRSRFADGFGDDKSETASSFSSASVMAASERTQNARGSPARRDKKKSDFRIGSRRGGDAFQELGETTEYGGRRVLDERRRLGDRASSRVDSRRVGSLPTSMTSEHHHRPGLKTVDFVAMTEAALRDPGVAPPARGGLFDDDDDDDDDPPGGVASAGAFVAETRGDETDALPGKDGATGGGLFDDDDDDDEARFEERAAPASATTRGLFESDDESDADDFTRGRRDALP
jgi:hypothetical protein